VGRAALEPAGATVAAETAAAVAKVDIDAHPGLAEPYRVQGVPTLQLFAGGDPVDQLVGVRDEATLGSVVERYS
jgi:thioredoxin 1